MGSKRSLAPLIAHRITADHPRSTVLDVFSGMCAVGSELATRHPLFTNDIHAFASVVADALFVSKSAAPTSLNAKHELLVAYNKNRNALRESLARRLSKETETLARAGDRGGWREFLEFNDQELERKVPTEVTGRGSLAKLRIAPDKFPYCLATSYFSSSYFGLSQAIDIDSLRFAIDQGPPRKRSYYLAALVQAASQCAAAPGHFAQYLVPRDRRTCAYVARLRSRSILARFFDALDTFPRIDCFDRKRNHTFSDDAFGLLTRRRRYFSNRDLVIYADPPYSRAQYSRYYHVLETLILYDYPACSGKGRYRGDRLQTGFSQKAQVGKAMTDFIAAAAETGAPLYLSYPTNGLLFETDHDLELILRKYYKVVRLVVTCH